MVLGLLRRRRKRCLPAPSGGSFLSLSDAMAAMGVPRAAAEYFADCVPVQDEMEKCVSFVTHAEPDADPLAVKALCILDLVGKRRAVCPPPPKRSDIAKTAPKLAVAKARLRQIAKCLVRKASARK